MDNANLPGRPFSNPLVLWQQQREQEWYMQKIDMEKQIQANYSGIMQDASSTIYPKCEAPEVYYNTFLWRVQGLAVLLESVHG